MTRAIAERNDAMTRILFAALLMASAAPVLSQNASVDEAQIRALNQLRGCRRRDRSSQDQRDIQGARFQRPIPLHEGFREAG
jgi:hypothetical protein